MNLMKNLMINIMVNIVTNSIINLMMNLVTKKRVKAFLINKQINQQKLFHYYNFLDN